MPTFNRASLIKDTITSCLQQTHQNFELIIVDGKSTDGTSDVMTEISDPRVHFIKSDVYLRRSKARNIGLERARGEYISFIDSDDLLEVNKLSEDIRLLKSDNSAGAIYTSAKCINESSGEILGFYKAEKSGDLYDEFAYYLPLVIATSQITMTRDVLNKVGFFDEDLDRFEDTDYFRRISRVTHWKANPELLVTLKNHSDNVISNQSQGTIIEMVNRYVSKVDDELRNNDIVTKSKSTNLYLHYAQALFVQKNGLRNSLRLYVKALRKHPRDSFTILISLLKILKHKFM